MAELKVMIPEELSRELSEFPEVDWSAVARDAIASKVFELRLSKSKELQRAVLEVLASKSKLTEKDALELGSKINEGLVQELRERKLV